MNNLSLNHVCFLCGKYNFIFKKCPIIKCIYNNINLNYYITNIIIKYLQCNHCNAFIHYHSCICALSMCDCYTFPLCTHFL